MDKHGEMCQVNTPALSEKIPLRATGMFPRRMGQGGKLPVAVWVPWTPPHAKAWATATTVEERGKRGGMAKIQGNGGNGGNGRGGVLCPSPQRPTKFPGAASAQVRCSALFTVGVGWGVMGGDLNNTEFHFSFDDFQGILHHHMASLCTGCHTDFLIFSCIPIVWHT